MKEDQFVEDLTLTLREVALVAQHYLNGVRTEEHYDQAYGPDGRLVDPLNWERLKAIRDATGDEEFQRMVEPVEQKSKERFDKLREGPAEPRISETCWSPSQRRSFRPEDGVCGRRTCEETWGLRQKALESLPGFRAANLLRRASCIATEMYSMARGTTTATTAQTEREPIPKPKEKS